MKKRNPSTVIAFIIFVVVLTVIHLNVFLFTSSSLKDSVISQAGKHLEFRKLDTHEGEVMKDPFPPQIHFRSPDKKKQINCDRFHKNYDVCSINNRFILDPVVSTFYLVDLTSIQSYVMEKIKPYPRKWDETVMLRINELKITSTASGPKCQTQHDLPALVFSAGGYTGNFFHDFNDGFIPLFITVNSIFPDQDFIFVISKANDWWIRRYTELLRAFSLHPIIDLDNDTSTHCFPNANIGLISHGFMTINPTLMPNSKGLVHFRSFLEKAYNPNQISPSFDNSIDYSHPRLVFISRAGNVGRVILNEKEAINVARSVGFYVTVLAPTVTTPLYKAYALINASHIMVGVHGAALTHSLFLQPGAIFMQVVPLGTEWVAKVCFENSAVEMGLQYMKYKINIEESSLVDKYGSDDLLVKDPVSFIGQNWSNIVMDIYLKEQNIRLDLVRFKKYLKRVYKKAKRFMNKHP